MSKRHDKLGIKQTIQKHWMDYVVKLMLSGLKEKELRSELDIYLAKEKPYVGKVPNTHAFIKSMLSAWFAPSAELLSFRNHAFSLIMHENEENWLPYHWAIISAAYPFWFNVAKQAGRLLNLQRQITSKQIALRLCEEYGTRESVWHYAKYVTRSFVSWDVLKDSDVKGCYEQRQAIELHDMNTVLLLCEAALHAHRAGQSSLELLRANPAFFPFQLPFFTSTDIIKHSKVIDAETCGFDDEILRLKRTR